MRSGQAFLPHPSSSLFSLTSSKGRLPQTLVPGATTLKDQ